MPDLKSFRREMLRIGPDELGEVHPIASLTTTTAVVSRLATGGISAQKYEGKYMLRAEGATADRERRCTTFASATGTFTHAGTNYSDTTATDEELEVLGFQSRFYDEAINHTLKRLHFMDVSPMPSMTNMGRYWLHDYDWIKRPSQIHLIEKETSPEISKNRYFEKRNSYSSGALVPDDWTLANGTQTYATITDTYQPYKHKFSVELTRAGTNVTFTQSIGILDTGVSADTLRGETVTAVLVGATSTASHLRVAILDGTTTTTSDYHTGGGAREELSCSAEVGSTATQLDLQIQVNTTDAAAQVFECYLLYTSAVDDNHRRDKYSRSSVYSKRYLQGLATLPVELPSMGLSSRYVIYSERPFPQFTQSRLDAGTADSDSSDAPLEIVATGAIGRLYERVSGRTEEDTRMYRALAFEWNRRFEELAKAHLWMPDSDNGVPIRRKSYGRQRSR